MGRYHARDLVRAPTLISLLRLPLGVTFFATVDRPVLALAVIAVAGLTDVVDGWLARRTDQVTAMGAVIDPITDKSFVACVIAALVLREKLPLLGVLALATREIGELPLVAWFALSNRARRARTEQPMANLPGKLVTTLQFASVTAALFGWAARDPLLIVTAVVGAIAAIAYWKRAIVTTRATLV